MAEIPAPCTRPTKAKDNAGMISWGTTLNIGICGRGRDRGTSVMLLSNSMLTASNKLRAEANAEPRMMAATIPNALSLVFSKTMINTMVTTPTPTVGQLSWNGLKMVSMARSTRPDPSDSYPLKFSNWPRTMFTPTALMNPTITALETNLSRNPSLSNPAANMTTPVRTARVHRARSGSSPECTAGTSATTIAIAPVACTAMNAELVARPPTKVPIM